MLTKTESQQHLEILLVRQSVYFGLYQSRGKGMARVAIVGVGAIGGALAGLLQTAGKTRDHALHTAADERIDGAQCRMGTCR